MSRLIDLDKALAKAEDECRMSDDWKVSHEMMNVFKYQPIVKAIPIEWIKKEIETYIREDSMDDYEYYYTDTLKLMLKRWEKENE